MDRIKKHFEDEAEVFDAHIIKVLPRYTDMVNALVRALPFQEDSGIKVMDLGCGTGTIVSKVKKRYKNARVTCVDFSENMLKMAREKLKKFEGILYFQEDVNHLVFDKEYDAVISSLALHHIRTDEGKRALYKRIYQTLSRGGVFYNADVILGETEYIQAVNMKVWKEFMEKSLAPEEVEKTFEKYYAEDVPARITEHLRWLKEAGFRNTEVIWKYYGSAVYGGAK